MCTRRKNSWNLQMFFSFPPTVYLRDSCGPSRFTELLLCRILHTFSGLHSTGCGDCELGLPKYFKIPILCPVNSNTADCIYWRTDFCISDYSWTPEKRLQANQLFSSNISMFQFRKEFLMFHEYSSSILDDKNNNQNIKICSTCPYSTLP